MSSPHLALVGLIFLLVGPYLPSQAQEADSTEKENTDIKRRYVENFNALMNTFDESYEGLKGSPMVSPTFVKGVVVTNRNARKAFEQLNYEAFQNEVVSLNEKGNVEFLPKKLMSTFCLYNFGGQDSVLFKKFRSQEDQHVFFGQVLYSGESIYIKKYEKYIQEADYQGLYSADIPYDEFKDRIKYFSVGKTGKMTPFKASKKGLEKLFPEKKSQIKAYWRKHYPNLKSDIALTRALEILVGE
ncbi:MAG: hypothetical protein AAF655_28530 [Bacteroidota bacterium]